MTVSFSFYMLSKGLNVQVCDATKVDKRATAGNTINTILN